MRPVTLLCSAILLVGLAVAGAFARRDLAEPSVAAPSAAVTETEPAAIPPAPSTAATLRAFFSREPACYTWTECFGDEPVAHGGGMVIYMAGDKVYSRAWYGYAEYVMRWPLVTGVGTLVGNTLHIAFRNGTCQPDHAFYYATCVFEFDPSDKSFKCSFMQKANPHPKVPVAPGNARGAYVSKPSSEYQQAIASVRTQAAQAPAPRQPGEGEWCPVVQREVDPDVFLEYQGKVYHFCCPACRDVFDSRPKAFTQDRRGD
jgi:YHS domain-containing protein